MGFFSTAKKVGGTVVNFKVTKWVGLDRLTQSTKQLGRITKSLVTPEQAEYSETFEEALKRLNLSEDQINARRIEFTKLMLIYLLISIVLFSYSVYIVYAYKNILGFFMGFSITLFALSHAFRYHFWVFQIKHKKLGCSVRDWFLDKH